jgi:hypothetical protein
MIMPIKEDNIGAVRANEYWYQGFYLNCGDIKYAIYYNGSCSCWQSACEINLTRRSITATLPSDVIAASVADILNKKDEICGMRIIDYFNNMGFDVYNAGWPSRLWHWTKGVFRRKSTSSNTQGKKE